MPSSPQKREVVEAFLDKLRNHRSSLETRMADSRDEATHEQSRPENKYDTRALEASYLAHGQGRRLVDLVRVIGWLDSLNTDVPHQRVGPGSLLRLDDVEMPSERWLLLSPVGGESISMGDQQVDLVGVQAPMAQACMGLEVDDEVALQRPTGTTRWVITIIL